MVDRIRALLASRQLTPTQFADLIQVGRPIVSHILSGRNKASLDVVQRIMAAFPDVALPWLLSGTGPMLAGLTPSTAAAVTTGELPVVVAPTLEANTPQSLTKALAKPPKPPQSPVSRPVSPSDSSGRPGETPVLPPVQSVATQREPASFSKPQRFRVAEAPPTSAAPTTLPSGVAQAQHGSESSLEPDVAPVKTALLPLVEEHPVEEHPASNEPRADTPASSNPAPAASFQSAVPPSPLFAPQSPLSEPLAGTTAINSPMASLAAAAEKPIRRIVIFYRDGSFSDFHPEE